MKIKVIAPIISDTFMDEMKKEFTGFSFPQTTIDVTNLDYGPASIESEYDEALCVPDFIEKVKQAEADGYDGVISNCFGDPGVKPAREVVDIPVIGPCEASMLFTSTLAKRFSVVTVLPNVVSMISNISKVTGVYHNLASIRYVNIPVLEVHEKEKLKSALLDEMLKAIKEDRAEALILGCTGFMGVASELQMKLTEKGYDIPVVDPGFAATKLLEATISMGVKQSRITYMKPPSKQRVMNTN